jgi:ankyrin repeat protein
VHWLLDQGSAATESKLSGETALRLACEWGHTPAVRLLLDRGADPMIARDTDEPLLEGASWRGYHEVVRLLLGHHGVKGTINHRDQSGRTALWQACFYGRDWLVRALLESGADSTIADNNGTTPMALITQNRIRPHVYRPRNPFEGREECLAELMVRHSHASLSLPQPALSLSLLSHGVL